MKLTYNVLCVDDEISSLEKTKSDLFEFNNNVGIETTYKDIEVMPGPREEPDPFWLRISAEIETAFAENVYDMILVDLHMPLDVSGDDVIAAIRELHTIYRPIIFYSAGNPETDDKALEQLNTAIIQANLLGKGVFITSRRDLTDQAKGIFNEMHNEEHKINRVRGLLMDRVSELDASIVEIVQDDRLWELVEDGSGKQKIVTEFRKYLQKDSDDANALLKIIKQLDVNAIQDFLKNNPKDISTYRKGHLLRSILKQVKELRSFAEVLKDGIEGDASLRGLRNEYGHTTAEELNNTHTDEKCISIRNESRRQINNINSIREKL